MLILSIVLKPQRNATENHFKQKVIRVLEKHWHKEKIWPIIVWRNFSRINSFFTLFVTSPGGGIMFNLQRSPSFFITFWKIWKEIQEAGDFMLIRLFLCFVSILIIISYCLGYYFGKDKLEGVTSHLITHISVNICKTKNS